MFSSNTSQVSNAANYIEDVFSTYLYSGTGAAQTITNAIDLANYGGLVWGKMRNNSFNNFLQDTIRGTGKSLCTNNTDGNVFPSQYITAFNSSGFTLGTNLTVNGSGYTYTSWAFRKQPKFYTQGTYTGTGSVQNIAHDLGSVPGFIIVKDTTNDGSAWAVYHRSNGNTKYMWLNSDAAPATSSGYWNNTDPTSTQFTVGTNGNVNQSGATFVYYVFAHDAGGFGLTGTDNVISCGSFTTDASRDATITLGYEPQWVLIKQTSAANSWGIYDTMRGWASSNQNYLIPNLNIAEGTINATNFVPTATGFNVSSPYENNATYIYIAIRRGPMKVPTSGTSVFSPNATTGSTGTAITTNFPVDLYVWQNRDGTYSNVWQDRLRGIPDTDTTGVTLTSQSTLAEQSGGYNGAYQPWNTGLRINSGASGANSIYWNFRRAPSFFDEVCYTGDGTNGKAYNHNLTVIPELVIVKSKSNTANWKVLYQPAMRVLTLNTTAAYESAANTKYYFGNDTIDISPTATQFTVSNGGSLNVSGAIYVTYLFATCPGVSKVGSYTGTGATQTISCGFTGGARFVLIKRTDSTGDWYVWDTARGMVSGTDPYLLLNSTAAEANANRIYTTTGGFEIVSTSAGINANGGTYIYLAIA